MQNIFDQFDALPQQPTDAAPSPVNVFDQFDEERPALMQPALEGSYDAPVSQIDARTREDITADAMVPKPTPVGTKEQDNSRIGDGLKPYFGGHNPIAETYDNFVDPFVPRAPKNDDEKALAEANANRTFTDRVVDSANFVGSLPVRMATRGEYGAGDLINLAAPGAGDAALASETRFTDANAPQLEVLTKAGELGAGTIGIVPSPRIERPNVRATETVMPPQAAMAAEDLAAFEQAGVRPFGPAFGQGPLAATAKQLTEAPFIGAPVKNALEESLAGTAGFAKEVADKFGSTASRETAGGIARDAMARYKDARPSEIVEREISGYTPEQITAIVKAPVRNTSLKTKQEALYQKAWSYIPDEIVDTLDGPTRGRSMKSGRAVEDAPRIMSNAANTRAVLNDITIRNEKMLNRERVMREARQNEPASDEFRTRQSDIPREALPVRGGLPGKIVEAILDGNWNGSLQTLRNIRSDFRRLASGLADTEKNTLGISQMERIQSALTKDIIGLLERNAEAYTALSTKVANKDPSLAKQYADNAESVRRSAREFRRADKFTAKSAERIEHIEKMFNAGDTKALFASIEQAAQTAGKTETAKLRTLARTLREPEMDEIRSMMIRGMGEPVGSARGFAEQIGFSVQSFATRWNKMDSKAKDILFDGEHRAAIDRLARMVNRNANVEALTNMSRSASNAMGVGAIAAGGGSLFSGSVWPILGSLSAGLAGSIIFSRPGYAKWAVRYAELREIAKRAPIGGRQLISKHVDLLKKKAETNPELIPALSAALSDIGGTGGQQPQ